MPLQVTSYLNLARESAAIADTRTGEEKKRLLAIAKEWLQLAQDRAKDLAEASLPPPLASK